MPMTKIIFITLVIIVTGFLILNYYDPSPGRNPGIAGDGCIENPELKLINQNSVYTLYKLDESCNAELVDPPKQPLFKRTNCNERGECFYDSIPLSNTKKIAVNQSCGIFVPDVIALIDLDGKLYECSPSSGA